MARLSPEDAEYYEQLELPHFPTTPFVVDGRSLGERRVAILTTAGLHRRSDTPYSGLDADYRTIPGDIDSNDLLMSHISVNYDRSGWQQDVNVVFPIERLRDLAVRGAIGSVADFHYAVMGATDPIEMEPSAREIAGLLHADHVDALLLAPV